MGADGELHIVAFREASILLQSLFASLESFSKISVFVKVSLNPLAIPSVSLATFSLDGVIVFFL